MKLSRNAHGRPLLDADRLRFPVIESLLETGAVDEALRDIGKLDQHLESVDRITFDPAFKRTCKTARDGLSNVSELLEHLKSLSQTTALKAAGTEDNHHV